MIYIYANNISIFKGNVLVLEAFFRFDMRKVLMLRRLLIIPTNTGNVSNFHISYLSPGCNLFFAPPANLPAWNRSGSTAVVVAQKKLFSFSDSQSQSLNFDSDAVLRMAGNLINTAGGSACYVESVTSK